MPRHFDYETVFVLYSNEDSAPLGVYKTLRLAQRAGRATGLIDSDSVNPDTFDNWDDTFDVFKTSLVTVRKSRRARAHVRRRPRKR